MTSRNHIRWSPDQLKSTGTGISAVHWAQKGPFSLNEAKHSDKSTRQQRAYSVINIRMTTLEYWYSSAIWWCNVILQMACMWQFAMMTIIIVYSVLICFCGITVRIVPSTCWRLAWFFWPQPRKKLQHTKIPIFGMQVWHSYVLLLLLARCSLWQLHIIMLSCSSKQAHKRGELKSGY